MDTKSDSQLLNTKAINESNKRESDEKMKNLTADLTKMIAPRMDQIKITKY